MKFKIIKVTSDIRGSNNIYTHMDKMLNELEGKVEEALSAGYKLYGQINISAVGEFNEFVIATQAVVKDNTALEEDPRTDKDRIKKMAQALSDNGITMKVLR